MIDKIIKNKIKEIEISKKKFPLNTFKDELKNSGRDFKKAISKNKLNLIAEIKRKSPSQNAISRKNALSFSSKSFFEIINIYNKYASAVSILTDGNFFGGSLNEIKDASKFTNLPLLRKDFIIDEYQIYESRLYNSDAILLIASELSDDEINRFIRVAKSLNMDCLVEIHTEEELKRVLDSDADIIGINNRNLKTLQIDTKTTLKLADKIPKNKIIVSESGISSNDYVKRLAGKVNAILVGTYFMKSENIENQIISLLR